jgi:lipopolysaccharide/colanic/teichoic acid biosynthesis glycosyltransferase
MICDNELSVKTTGYSGVSVLFSEEYHCSGMRELLSWPVSRRYLIAKRILDIVLAGLALLLSLPILIVAGLAIVLTSRGPMIFRQRRAGLMGRTFMMYKLRTMRAGQTKDIYYGTQEGRNGPAFKLKNDPRVTAVGRFLRRTSIDELPQLVNVLLGQMSLVGPRPLPLDQVRVDSIEERSRLTVKPGLTGLWQISGRADVPYEAWIEMDLYYVQHQSLWFDLQILLKTIPAVFSCRGAY